MSVTTSHELKSEDLVLLFNMHALETLSGCTQLYVDFSTLNFFCQMQSFALPNPIFLHMQLPCGHSFVEKFLYQNYEVLVFKTIYLKLANLVQSLHYNMVSAPQFTRGYCRCITVQLSAIWSKVDIVFTTVFLWKCSVQGASSSFLYIVNRYWPIFLVLVSSLPVYWLLWLEPMLPVANHVVFHETLPSQV